MNKGVSWLKSLSVTKKILLGIVAIGILGAAGGGTPSSKVNLTSSQANIGASQAQQQSLNKPATKAPAITTKTETDTQAVPFTSTTVQTSTLPKGTTKVTTAGVNGSEILTYQLTFTNGVQTNKTLTTTTVTTPAVNQVTSVGTYIAPASAPATANTYTNVDGNQIESPDSNSAGATGVCNDGTYTHAVHHQGACSSHGGVSYWL